MRCLYLFVFILGLTTAVANLTTAADSIENPGKRTYEYFSIEVNPLIEKFDDSNVAIDQSWPRHAFYQMDTTPRVVVPRGSEAYVFKPEQSNGNFAGYRVVGRKPIGETISGNLYLLHTERNKTVLGKFELIIDEKTTSATGHDYLLAKGQHFQRLWSEEMAGAAMFRHLATKSLAEIGESAESTGPNWPMRRRDGIDDSIQLMSGGRAVSENLQLDQQIATTATEGNQRSLANVRGITVREINWKTRLSDEPTQLDPLATSVPHDQYAVFLPSFGALTKIFDQSDRLARPIVQWVEPQSRRTDVLAFYQAQLGLPLNALTRQVGGALIEEVVITGSDPYFRTGTDLAILMQSAQPKFLQQALVTQVAAEAAAVSGVDKLDHQFSGHPIQAWVTADRRFCSYIAATDDAVIVSNSLGQVQRLLNCADGKQKSLGNLDEYKFFRQRYRRQADKDAALAVISDATIRKWCSPQWRIAASRRTRARATIAEMSMRNADALLDGSIEGVQRLAQPTGMPNAGQLSLTSHGVHSSKYGTLAFQTPIAEMDMGFASVKEVELYERWRNRYERQWRNAFDPIALELSLDAKSMMADLSVIPLMIRTDYRQWLNWVGDARLRAGAGDEHAEALASLDVAVNPNSTYLAMARSVINQRNANIDLLGWIDGSFSLYLDNDPDWIKRLAENSPYEWPSPRYFREAPVGFYVPSKDNLRMAGFMVALRALLDQFAPNVVRWDQRNHNGMAYSIATVVENNTDVEADELPRGYYVTTPDGLTASLNEQVIKRAIDRHLERKKAASEAVANAEGDEQDEDLAGPQIKMHVTGKAIGAFGVTSAPTTQRRMSRLAWSNVPILNYFRHRYPDRDPLAVYRKLLGQELAEPAGGKYRWNDQLETYVSTHYGHHLAPQAGPTVIEAIGPEDKVETTLSFQDDGLRATLKITAK